MLDNLFVPVYTSLGSFCKFWLKNKNKTKLQALNLGEPVVMRIPHIQNTQRNVYTFQTLICFIVVMYHKLPFTGIAQLCIGCDVLERLYWSFDPS